MGQILKYEKLSNALNEIREVAFAYVFGSSQHGTVKDGSDVDIAVYLTKNENDANLRLKIIRTLEGTIESFNNFDILVLNTASSILAMQALQGKLLFVKPEYEDLFAEFYSYTCRKYEYDSFWMKKQLEYRGYEVKWDN
jgi:predicted nucleotidyltransferase